jgi:hypothetical protein
VGFSSVDASLVGFCFASLVASLGHGLPVILTF